MDSYYEIAIINEEGYTAHDNSWDWSDAVKIANELKKSHNDERVVVTEYKGVGTVYEAEGRRELKYLNPEDLVELLKKYPEFKREMEAYGFDDWDIRGDSHYDLIEERPDCVKISYSKTGMRITGLCLSISKAQNWFEILEWFTKIAWELSKNNDPLVPNCNPLKAMKDDHVVESALVVLADLNLSSATNNELREYVTQEYERAIKEIMRYIDAMYYYADDYLADLADFIYDIDILEDFYEEDGHIYYKGELL